MTSNFTLVRNGSIALIAFVLLALPISAVHAADDGSFDFYPDSSYDVYPDQSYDFYDAPSYDFYPEQDSYDFYPDTSYDYGYSPSYLGSSYLGGSYLGGASYLPVRTVTSGGQTQTQAQSQAQVSNNTNVNNNIITVNVPSTPAPVYPAPVYNYPVCTLTVSNYNNTYPYNYNYQPVTLSWTSQYATSGSITGIGSVAVSGSVTVNPQYTTTYTGTFYGQNGQSVTCSATVTRGPVAYNPTPYVALSAVPYTGLDLGFWGTIAYWGFLVLWCLVAAYLVVVKKVQNKILRSLNSFLFGDSVTTVTVAPAAAAPVAKTYAAPAVEVDAIDSFILSQINRATR